MTLKSDVERVLEVYPRIHAAWERQELRIAEIEAAVTRHQIELLAHLDPKIALSVSEIAGLMETTASTASLNLDRLEADRLIRRTRDRRDRRRVLVFITARGRQLRDEASLLDPSRVRRLLRAIPASKRDAALEGLAILARAAATSRRGPGSRRRP